MKTKSAIGWLILTGTLWVALAGEDPAGNPAAQGGSDAAPEDVLKTNAPLPITVLDSTLPADVEPDSPYAQLVRMVQAGVDEGVMIAYIKQSPRFFELSADNIIYLTDIGTPPGVIEAVLEHDRMLIDDEIGIQNQAAVVEAESAAELEEEPPEVALDDFYTELAPYGSWVYIEGYGRCWRPTVVINNPDWQPYCDNGRWVYSHDDWYWMSNYSWGWAAFHYGRWVQHGHYGWCWWPDTVWAPSWVYWRYNSSYCGWAPLPPYSVYQTGVGWTYRGSAVSLGFGFNLSHSHYTFVSARDFCDRNIRRHRLPTTRVERIYDSTEGHLRVDVKSRRKVVNRGVPVQYIAEATEQEIKPVSIRYRTNHAGRRSGIETLEHSRRTVVVNRPDAATAAQSAAASSVSSRNDSNRERSQPAARRPASRPAPSVNRSSSNPPVRSSRPAPSATRTERPSRPAPAAPSAQQPSSRREESRSNRNTPTPRVSSPRTTRPAPASPSSPKRVQPKQSGGSSRVRSQNRSANPPSVNRSSRRPTPNPAPAPRSTPRPKKRSAED